MPRVARKSDEEVWLAMLAQDCHCVPIASMEVSRGACEGSWQDDRNSYTSCRTGSGVTCEDVVTKVVVQLCSQLRLVVAKVLELCCFSLDPREAAKLLEETLRSIQYVR